MHPNSSVEFSGNPVLTGGSSMGKNMYPDTRFKVNGMTVPPESVAIQGEDGNQIPVETVTVGSRISATLQLSKNSLPVLLSGIMIPSDMVNGNPVFKGPMIRAEELELDSNQNDILRLGMPIELAVSGRVKAISTVAPYRILLATVDTGTSDEDENEEFEITFEIDQ